eukprot:611423-Amphidinium_carterae.1
MMTWGQEKGGAPKTLEGLSISNMAADGLSLIPKKGNDNLGWDGADPKIWNDNLGWDDSAFKIARNGYMIKIQIELMHAFLVRTMQSAGRQVEVRKYVVDMVLVAAGPFFAHYLRDSYRDVLISA